MKRPNDSAGYNTSKYIDHLESQLSESKSENIRLNIALIAVKEEKNGLINDCYEIIDKFNKILQGRNYG